MEDANIHVRAVRVDDPPLAPAFAYRLDARDRAIVIAGNARPSDRLIRFAYGADILVLEMTNTSADEAGRAAKRARVKTLVVTPHLPAKDPQVTDQMWLDAARTHFPGTVVLGRELLEL
jgi:ribonuclease BN (tRNA processing enzyme)